MVVRPTSRWKRALTVRLVGGTIAIESKPMGGRTVLARVSLESKPRFQPTVV